MALDGFVMFWEVLALEGFGKLLKSFGRFGKLWEALGGFGKLRESWEVF